MQADDLKFEQISLAAMGRGWVDKCLAAAGVPTSMLPDIELSINLPTSLSLATANFLFIMSGKPS